MIHAIRNHFARLAELPAGKAWWRIGLESLIVTIAVAIPIATFVDKPRALLTLPLLIVILLALVIAPLLETVLGQWLPVAATARLRGRLGIQVAVATAVFALLHVGEGFVFAICPGVVGFYLAWNFAHQRRRSTGKALITTAGIHFVQNLGAVILLGIQLAGPLVGGSGLLPSPRTWLQGSEAAAARLHRKLQADPTDKRAMDRMLRLMDRGACTQEQVEFIARTVLVPEVVARQVYSAAVDIGVLIRFPDGALPRLPRWQVNQDLRISIRDSLGDVRASSHSSGGGRERQSRLFHTRLPARGPTEPEDYTCELNLTYTYTHCRLRSLFQYNFGFAMVVMQENINPATGSWIEPPMEALTMKEPSTKFTPVTARFTRTIAFSVQPDSEVVPIRLLRSPQLDRTMEKRVVPYPLLATLDGHDKSYRGIFGVAFRDLPCAVAWEPVFVDAQGREHNLIRDPTMAWDLIRIVSQGDPGVIGALDLADWSLDLPFGKHPGHLLLHTDPKLAFLDPEIEEIWGGELRFPTTIVVSPGSSAHAANSPEPSDTTNDATRSAEKPNRPDPAESGNKTFPLLPIGVNSRPSGDL